MELQTPASTATGPDALPPGSTARAWRARLYSGAFCALLLGGLYAARHAEVVPEFARRWQPASESQVESEPIDALFQQLEAAAQAGSMPEVEALCRSITTQHPEHPWAEPAHVRIVQARVAASDPAGAMSAFREFRLHSPQSSLLPEALLDLASCQYAAGEFTAAARTYTELVAHTTNANGAVGAEDTAPPVIWRSMRLWKEHKRQERSRSELERLGRFNQALCYEHARNREAALRAYDHFLSRFPYDERVAEAHFHMAALHLDAGAGGEALPHFRAVYEAAEAADVLRSESIYRAGQILQAMRRTEDAAATYRHAAAIRPADDNYRLASLAEMANLIAARRPLDAIAVYRDIAASSTQPAWRAVALEKLSALEVESSMLVR